MSAGYSYKVHGMNPRGPLCCLEGIVHAAYPRWHALIGIDRGHAMYAMTQGLRSACKDAREKPSKRLWCFHWVEGWERAREIAHDISRRRHHRHSMLNIARPCVAKDGQRTRWREEIAGLVEEGVPAFGIVAHVGVGTAADIRGDLLTLLPLMDDDTTIALCGLDRAGPRNEFLHMTTQKQWDGVILGDGTLGILQRRAARKKEQQNG